MSSSLYSTKIVEPKNKYIGLNYWWTKYQNIKAILREYSRDKKLNVEESISRLLEENRSLKLSLIAVTEVLEERSK